tara:strand:- start:64 stop:423 length:360 start_codon:yes stop_codon:yes gene_type:complete
MPIYQFQHPNFPDRIVDIIQSMSEPHVYIDEEGVEWQRIWNSPNASIDTQNDGSKEGFMRHTQNKKGGTIGDLWDASREASEKRKKEYGQDKVQQKFEKNYSKKRRGMKRKGSQGGATL